MNTTRLTFLLLGWVGFTVSIVEGTELIPLFPSPPARFAGFENVAPVNGCIGNRTYFRFHLISLEGEQKQTFILFAFQTEAIASNENLNCHIEYQTYVGNELLKHRELELNSRDATALLNAIDKSEMFSLPVFQQKRRLLTSGRLIIAEEIANNEVRRVTRCTGSSAPVEFLLNYLQLNIANDL